MKNKKGFTLIELLAVLVVLAILALISIPITIRIINQSRENSYKRSIVSYGKTFEKVIAIQNIDDASNGYKTDLNSYTEEVEKNYTGSRVQCDLENSSIENGKLNLVGCMIVKEIKDIYNPSDRISKNLYQYKDGKVEKQEAYDYVVGDCNKSNTYVTYKGQKWCVIKNSKEDEDYVTVMRYYPMSVSETSRYGYDNDIFIMNQYGIMQTEYEGNYIMNGMRITVGLVKYNSTETCGYLTGGDVNSLVETNCDNNYNNSRVKWFLDKYKDDELTEKDLKQDSSGNYIRLITKDELESNLYYKDNLQTTATPNWVMEGPSYWTMTKVPNTTNKVYVVDGKSGIQEVTIYGGSYLYRYGYIRPVINVYKSAIGE